MVYRAVAHNDKADKLFQVQDQRRNNRKHQALLTFLIRMLKIIQDAKLPILMVGVISNSDDRIIVEEFFQLFKTPWEFL